MNSRIVALLDRPSPDSFGIVPFAAESGGRIVACGFSVESRHRVGALEPPALHGLVETGHALQVRSVETKEAIAESSVALWIGERFQRNVDRFLLPPAPLPSPLFREPTGSFAVGDSENMYDYLEMWVNSAFRKFRETDSKHEKRRIAELMRWVLPHHIATLSASWHTSSEPDLELDFQHRTFGPTGTKEQWKLTLSRYLRDYQDRFADIEVIAFTGESGTKRFELARGLASLLKDELEFTSFRSPLLKSIPRHLDPYKQKLELMTIGQRAVDSSPLSFALSVFPNRIKRPTLIVDSVRHERILQTIKWLKPKRIFLVRVLANERERRKRLANFDPDKLRSHPTERDIRRLPADLEVDGDDQTSLERLANVLKGD